MTIEAILQNIRAASGRITPAKRAVIEALFEAEKPISLRMLREALKRKKLTPERTTLYRLLLSLEACGVVESVALSPEERWYELKREHHHHLICSRCHGVEDVVLDEHLEQQEKRILRTKKFRVEHHLLEFYGTCAKCNQKVEKLYIFR